MKVTRSAEHKPTDAIDVGNIILRGGRRIEICIGYGRGGCIDYEVPHLWKRSVSTPEPHMVRTVSRTTIRNDGEPQLRLPAVFLLVKSKFRLIVNIG